MAGYYPQLDIIRVDADGVRIPLPGEDIDATNITTAGGLFSLDTSDANGIIVGNSLGGGHSIGDVIELSHATYPGTLRITLAESEYLATNNPVAYVAEDLSAQTIPAKYVDIYIQDLDNPTPPVKVGSGLRGQSIAIPLETTVAKNYRVYAVSITERDAVSETEFEQLPFDDIAIPAPPSGSSGWTLTTKTSNYTVLAADDGTLFDNTGAGGTVSFDFNTTGMVAGESRFAFRMVTTGNVLEVVASDLLDPINGAVASLSNTTTVGAYIELLYVGSGDFQVIVNGGFNP